MQSPSHLAFPIGQRPLLIQRKEGPQSLSVGSGGIKLLDFCPDLRDLVLDLLAFILVLLRSLVEPLNLALVLL